MLISACAKSTAPGALAAKLLPIQDGRVFDSGMDPCKACTIKRDGKHLLGAGTAGSLAKKYGLRRCVGQSSHLETEHLFGQEQSAAISGRWSPVAQGGMCA